MKKEQYFIGAPEIAEMVGCGKSKAYKFIQQMNKELDEKGLLTFPGRVPRRYAMERFGIEEVQDNAGKSDRAAGGNSGGTASGNRKHRRGVRFPAEAAG